MPLQLLHIVFCMQYLLKSKLDFQNCVRPILCYHLVIEHFKVQILRYLSLDYCCMHWYFLSLLHNVLYLFWVLLQHE